MPLKGPVPRHSAETALSPCAEFGSRKFIGGKSPHCSRLRRSVGATIGVVGNTSASRSDRRASIACTRAVLVRAEFRVAAFERCASNLDARLGCGNARGHGELQEYSFAWRRTQPNRHRIRGRLSGRIVRIRVIMDLLETADKDLPLRDDIRLLGRILGDTVRSQEGEPVFAIVERIRRTSIRFHRDEDEAARHELEATLNSLSHGQSIQIIRAFSYFSHLANIAEDQHHIRRTRAHALAASAPREGTIAHALARARDAAISRSRLQNFFTSAIVCPVLTAHPTEVRRKSAIDREMEVAHLLAERDRLRLTPEEAAANEEALRRAVLTLWQTSMLRGSRLKVIDEIANGLSYYDYTFLRELPRFYAALEDQLASTDPAWDNFELPSFLRVGSWIGGDRDGNPF